MKNALTVAKEYVEFVKKSGIPVTKAYLFGSYAKKTENWTKALAFLAGAILIDHVFEEGNKRTAALLICQKYTAILLVYNQWTKPTILFWMLYISEHELRNLQSRFLVNLEIKDFLFPENLEDFRGCQKFREFLSIII